MKTTAFQPKGGCIWATAKESIYKETSQALWDENTIQNQLNSLMWQTLISYCFPGFAMPVTLHFQMSSLCAGTAVHHIQKSQQNKKACAGNSSRMCSLPILRNCSCSISLCLINKWLPVTWCRYSGFEFWVYFTHQYHVLGSVFCCMMVALHSDSWLPWLFWPCSIPKKSCNSSVLCC